MQQQGLLDRHRANRHQRAGQQTKEQKAQAVQADQQRGTESRPTVLIGKDTRISGYMLESALDNC